MNFSICSTVPPVLCFRPKRQGTSLVPANNAAAASCLNAQDQGQFTRSPGWWLKRSIFLLRRFQLPVGCACSLVQDVRPKWAQTIFEGFPFYDLWDMLFVLIFMLPPKPSNVNTIFLTTLRITDKINMCHSFFSANVMVEQIIKCGAAARQQKTGRPARGRASMLCRHPCCRSRLTSSATHCSALLKLQGIPLERSEIQNDSEYTLSLYEIDFFETTSFHGRNVIHGVRLRLSARGSGLFFGKDIPTNLIVWGWFCAKKSPLWNLFFLYYK